MQKIIGFMCVSMVVSCATNNDKISNINALQGTKNMQIEQIVQDHGSLTQKLKTLNEHFTIEVLKTGADATEYRRTIAEKLNNIPVVMASSYTNLNNTFFVNLLANSATKSIGETLFAHDSKIKRNQMINQHIQLGDINNITIQDYLYKLGYTATTEIAYRDSIFTLNNESMHIDEYFLPSLEKFTKPTN